MPWNSIQILDLSGLKDFSCTIGHDSSHILHPVHLSGITSRIVILKPLIEATYNAHAYIDFQFAETLLQDSSRLCSLPGVVVFGLLDILLGGQIAAKAKKIAAT